MLLEITPSKTPKKTPKKESDGKTPRKKTPSVRDEDREEEEAEESEEEEGGNNNNNVAFAVNNNVIRGRWRNHTWEEVARFARITPNTNASILAKKEEGGWGGVGGRGLLGREDWKNS